MEPLWNTCRAKKGTSLLLRKLRKSFAKFEFALQVLQGFKLSTSFHKVVPFLTSTLMTEHLILPNIKRVIV